MEGYIKLHRKLLEWEWYDDLPTFRVFMHLLLKANYKEKKWHDIVIKEGEVLTSRKKLALETGLTERQIRTALTKLKTTNEIASKSTPQYTIIQIVKWKEYQIAASGTTNERPTSDQPTTNERPLHKKEKKDNNINNYINNINPATSDEVSGTPSQDSNEKKDNNENTKQKELENDTLQDTGKRKEKSSGKKEKKEPDVMNKKIKEIQEGVAKYLEKFSAKGGTERNAIELAAKKNKLDADRLWICYLAAEAIKKNLVSKYGTEKSIVKEAGNVKLGVYWDMIRKLIEIDHYTIEELERFFKWLPTNDFWSGNILSIQQIRKRGKSGVKKIDNAYKSMQERGKKDMSVSEQMKKYGYVKEVKKGADIGMKIVMWEQQMDRWKGMYNDTVKDTTISEEEKAKLLAEYKERYHEAKRNYELLTAQNTQ